MLLLEQAKLYFYPGQVCTVSEVVTNKHLDYGLVLANAVKKADEEIARLESLLEYPPNDPFSTRQG